MRYKKEIIDILTSQRHARVEDMYNALKKQHTFLSVATVYRNVKILERKREIIGFSHPDGTIRYEITPREHHQHLICEECGVIKEIQFGFIEELSQNIEKRINFTLHRHRLSIIGICSDCKNLK